MKQLKKKYGPFPLWAWVIAAAGIGYWYYRKRQSQAANQQGAATSQFTPTYVPGGGTPVELAGGGGYYGGGGNNNALLNLLHRLLARRGKRHPKGHFGGPNPPFHRTHHPHKKHHKTHKKRHRSHAHHHHPHHEHHKHPAGHHHHRPRHNVKNKHHRQAVMTNDTHPTMQHTGKSQATERMKAGYSRGPSVNAHYAAQFQPSPREQSRPQHRPSAPPPRGNRSRGR